MIAVEVRRAVLAALRARSRPLARLAAWSGVEALPALLAGLLTARAVDEGFLAGRPLAGFAWLAVLAAAVVVGGVGTGWAYGCLGDIVEPFRDELANRVVTGAVHRSIIAGARPDNAAVARLTHQVEIVRDTFAGLIMVVRGFLFTAGAALLGLLTLAPVIGALVAVPLLAGLIMFGATLPAMAARQRDYVLADDRLGEAAGALLTGHRDVVACRAEEVVVAEVDRPVAAQAATERALARMAALRSLTLAVGGWAPLALLLTVAPWLVGQGLSAGAVLGALIYVCTGLQPALRALVLGIASGGLRFVVTLERVLSTTPEPVPASLAAFGGDAPCDPLPRPATGAAGRRDAVRLRGVTFRYGPAARPVVEDFDLLIPEGEHLAVVGPSGAGKSTLASLIAGMLAPETGTVHLAGVPIAGRDPATLAGLRVLVPQDPYVFTGTLAENLRYLRPTATDAELDAALDALALRSLADRLGGLTTVIDPALLATGERQLIATARAYLAPAPLVILDEATGQLDPSTEAAVERAFAARPGALLVVAHRLSSARRAHRVLMLDGARTALDRHDRLLERSAAYRDLVGQEHGPDRSIDRRAPVGPMNLRVIGTIRPSG